MLKKLFLIASIYIAFSSATLLAMEISREYVYKAVRSLSGSDNDEKAFSRTLVKYVKGNIGIASQSQADDPISFRHTLQTWTAILEPHRAIPIVNAYLRQLYEEIGALKIRSDLENTKKLHSQRKGLRRIVSSISSLASLARRR